MSNRLPLTISLKSGEKFNCNAVIEDDIISSGWAFGGKQSPGAVELEIPPALHRKTFTDEDDPEWTYSLADLEEIILFAINDGGVKKDTIAGDVSFELHGELYDEPEPGPYYLVGDLVEHLFDSTPEQAVEKGAFLFSDEVSARTFAMAHPDFSVHEVDALNIDPDLPVRHVAEAFVGVAKKKMAQDYQGDIDANLMRKNAEKYFPDTLCKKSVDSMVSVMIEESQGKPIASAIEGNIPESMGRQMLESAAAKIVWQNRTTIPGRDIEKHVPNIPASANLVSENMDVNIDGNHMRGTMVFYQRPNSYFDRNADEKPLVPVAFLSPDGTGDYVLLDNPSIMQLQDSILSQRVGMANEVGPENEPMKPKVSH